MCAAALRSARHVAALALLLAWIHLSVLAHARIFTCEDGSGRVILRDVPCKRTENPREAESKQDTGPAARAAEAHPQSKQAAKLSDAQVRELAQSIDAAFAKRDIKMLLAVLANDAVFEIEVRALAGVEVLRYNREDYTARMREGFKLGNDFAYERTRNDIMLGPGEEYAEIVAWARQSFWVQEQWQQGDARSRWSVEMREGRPQITLLRAVITPAEQP